MSQVRRPETVPPSSPEVTHAVPIGERVLQILDVAWRARRPLLLEGPTGIGKSQIVAQFAARAGIGFQVLDLSLLEPPDLIGLPVVRDGRTHYAHPAELPLHGHGVLMLEELNRAEIPVMQPALQLLSARRLHAYELPAGWTCVAAINPEHQEYQVNRLDPALRSRFLQVPVRAGRDEWLAWARAANLSPVVLGLVRDHPDVFATSSPRSWAYVAEVLQQLRPEELRDRELLLTLVRGYLPVAWSVVVAETVSGLPPAPRLDLDQLLGRDGEAWFAGLLGGLAAQHRADIVALLAWELRRACAGPEVAAAVAEGRIRLEGWERILAPLPGDLREQCLESLGGTPTAGPLLAGVEIDVESLLRDGYAGTPAQRAVRHWLATGLGHRVRLLVCGVLDRLRRQSPDGVGAPDSVSLSALQPLIDDAGMPRAHDLALYLRTRTGDRIPETA